MPHRFNKGGRALAREFALLAVYDFLMTGKSREELDTSMLTLTNDALDKDDFARADKAYYGKLVTSVTENVPELTAQVEEALDRDIARVSFVERAILFIAATELKNHLEIPYRVIINEAVELAKNFGGNEGYRYVNGVLDKIAKKCRPNEA